MIKEACVEGFTEALQAQDLGADRVELCENLAVGGTTPSIGTLMACKKYLSIPVIVMIRPRGGDFVYSEKEMEIMAEDIKRCRQAGADGIAIGLLKKSLEIDMTGLARLVKYAGNMQVTFHKAIDATGNIEQELLRLCDVGLVHRVLTSGGASTALEGAGMLKNMIEIAKGKVTILVAGKVTKMNIDDLSRLIPAVEFHGRKIVGNLSDLT